MTAESPILAWHFVGERMLNGRPVPPDGKTLRHDGPMILCVSGLHASEQLIDALQYAPGATLCQVWCGGEIVRGPDKLICRERTILWRLDAAELLQEFARWCALDVAHLLDSGDAEKMAAVRDAANAAARAAVRDAARAAAKAACWAAWAAANAAQHCAAGGAPNAAAWGAARDAARAAAWAAARNAAWDAARAAAWDWVTAWKAARDAAWDAARAAQNKRLIEMVATAAEARGLAMDGAHDPKQR